MNRNAYADVSQSSSQECSLATAAEQPAAASVAREIDWNEKKEKNSRDAGPGAIDEIELSGPKVGEEEEAATSSVRRLKSATLDRMGRMLKIHSKSSGEKPDVPVSGSASDEPTRKQKFNSLTRMLRLSDNKEHTGSSGANGSKSSRGRSLTRILARRKVPVEGDAPSDKPDDHIRGIFSRILGQIRGRASKTDSGVENNSQKSKDKPCLPKSPSNLDLSELTLESSCPVVNSHP